MSKSILEAMGMADQDKDDEDVEEQGVIVTEGQVVVQGDDARGLDTIAEDQQITTSYQDLDVLIREGMASMREAWALAPNMDPRYTNRALEVGALIMKTTLEAVTQRQEFALKEKEFKLEKASTGIPSQVTNTNVNTIITTDRNAVLAMIADKKKAKSEQDS